MGSSSRSVLCEGDRREAELCLYTGLIGSSSRDIRMVVLLLLLSFWNVTLGIQIRIVGVDLVEKIGKRSIFGLQTTINR
jgi:hypothetical protein